MSILAIPSKRRQERVSMPKYYSIKELGHYVWNSIDVKTSHVQHSFCLRRRRSKPSVQDSK